MNFVNPSGKECRSNFSNIWLKYFDSSLILQDGFIGKHFPITRDVEFLRTKTNRYLNRRKLCKHVEEQFDMKCVKKCSFIYLRFFSIRQEANSLHLCDLPCTLIEFHCLNDQFISDLSSVDSRAHRISCQEKRSYRKYANHAFWFVLLIPVVVFALNSALSFIGLAQLSLKLEGGTQSPLLSL